MTYGIIKIGTMPGNYSRKVKTMKKKILVLIVILQILLCLPAYAQERLRMSTTTSTDNSGLLEELLPPFEKMFNVKVDVIAVGTGKALQLGRNGDVDIVFVHARDAEDKFVEGGFGVNRRDVMSCCRAAAQIPAGPLKAW